MFAKIFSQIYDGTLGGDWKALVTFQQILILSNEDGVIDMTPSAIHRVTGIPLDIIEHGISKLSEPDPHSRSSVHEGRRIVLLDPDRPWGWVVVNKMYYRDIGSREDKKRKDRERIAAKRATKTDVSQSVADSRKESPDVANVAHTYTYTNTYTDTKEKRGRSFKTPTVEEVKAYCAERKNSVNAETWHNFYEANGWKVGKNKMVDWKAAVRTWEQRTDNKPAKPKDRYVRA